MRKLITLFFITSLGLTALSGCGVKRPLYEPSGQNQNTDVELNQQKSQDQQEK